MKKIVFLVTLLCTMAVSMFAADIVFTHANWKVTYVEATHAFRMQATSGGSTTYQPVITNNFPEATYTDLSNVSQKITTLTNPNVTYTAIPLNDIQFGTGICHSFNFKADNQAVILTENFYAYDNCNYLITELQLDSPNEIKSNYLAPIFTNTAYRILPASSNNRMIKVPFDNDGFQRYHRYQLSTSMTSYEVTAIYSADTRNGLVLGSIDHDHWKSAIDVSANSNSNISNLKAYSGVSSADTRDLIPHGMLRGTSIKSARFYVDFNDDWRDGLDGFAKANNNVVKKNSSWLNGTPMGWQSWGVLAEKSNNTDVTEISDYYYNVLQPGGFHNSQGNVVFSLDASDGLTNDQRKALCVQGVDRKQFIGNYSTPFSLWWGEGDADSYVGTINGVSYTVRDISIKVNGQPYRYDGAWALDPTHPKVKQDIVNFVNAAAAAGIKYIKCDFVNAGIIQSDSYYKQGIYTAVEAYNDGMRYLAERAAAKGIFIAFSISPLFPYQYANSRRIACDTWATIDQTEYSMNAISSGWWTSGLYQYNDPDHVVLVGNGDQGNTSEGENRARFTNAAVTGMVLVADNFSTTNVSQRGNPTLSKARANNIMLNTDINEMADLGVSFRPLYGCKEFQSSEARAENFHVYRTEKYLYVAGINYGSSNITGTINLSDLGINNSDFSEVRELWTGNSVSAQTDLPYDIPYKDARVYRFTLTPTNIKTINNNNQDINYYDVEGRQVKPNKTGVYVTNRGSKILIKK